MTLKPYQDSGKTFMVDLTWQARSCHASSSSPSSSSSSSLWQTNTSDSTCNTQLHNHVCLTSARLSIDKFHLLFRIWQDLSKTCLHSRPRHFNDGVPGLYTICHFRVNFDSKSVVENWVRLMMRSLIIWLHVALLWWGSKEVISGVASGLRLSPQGCTESQCSAHRNSGCLKFLLVWMPNECIVM